MKKPKLHILTAVTLIFAAFTMGLFVGRNQQKGDISLSVPTEVTAPRIAAVETAAAAETTLPPTTEAPVLFPININTASKEELIAEIGAAALVNHSGLENSHSLRNSAAYIQNWLQVLKDDKRFIVSAAGKAEKAVNLILNV